MAEDATAVAVTDEDRELATKPVHGLFVKYSLITLIGMAAQAVMVILEGVIIGNGLGSFGLAVVGIIMPLELLNLALGGSLGMGVATVAGNRLGAGDMAGARKAFGQGFWLSTYLILAVSALIFIFAPQIALMLAVLLHLPGEHGRCGRGRVLRPVHRPLVRRGVLFRLQQAHEVQDRLLRHEA